MRKEKKSVCCQLIKVNKSRQG